MINHSSYKIYLTRSCEAAMLISNGLRAESERQGYRVIGSGKVLQDCRIPALYHNSGFYYAYAEYENGDNWDTPKYELIIC